MRVTRGFQFRRALERRRGRCGVAVESLSRLSEVQIRLLREAVSSVSCPSWTEIRLRAGIHFWVSVFGLVLFTALIWFPDLIDGMSNRILLVLLYAAIPLSALLETTDDGAERRRFIWWHLGFGLLNLGLLLMAISNKFDWPHLGVHVLLIMISSPFLLVFAVVIWRTPLIGVALVPSTIIDSLVKTRFEEVPAILHI